MFSLKRKRKAARIPEPVPAEGDGPDVLVENLYKKNIELSVRNKTLSLLSKLYEIGILTLSPKDLASHIAKTVQADLSFELVGIYTFDKAEDCLNPLHVSESDKLAKIMQKLKVDFTETVIHNASDHEFFGQGVRNKVQNMTNDVEQAWDGVLKEKELQALSSKSNIKTVLLHPLTVENRVLGVIVFALNRDYETLTQFEKESEKSIVNVIALALEKAFLYKQLEDANSNLKELDRQKDELLSMVSHQLAAPVTAIKWYIELLLDEEVGSLNKEQKTQIGTMQNLTTNLSELISMILDVSRIQLGRMKVEKQKMPLTNLVEEILKVIQPKIEEKQLKFGLVDKLKTKEVAYDKRLTRMTIENLLTNAVKYTSANGKVTLKLEEEPDWVVISVADTGIGIPKTEQDKIFAKLFRASNVRDKVEGNGFGLFVAKGAIESQGGSISFQSEEGKGTTFRVRLPTSER